MVPAIAKAHPRPDTPEWVSVFVNAIRDLEGERVNNDYRVNKIPWRAIHEYGQSFIEEDLAGFVDIVSDADTFLVRLRNKRIQNQMGNT